MPGESSGWAVTVSVRCLGPEAHGNVVGNAAVPHVPQGLVNLPPVPLIEQSALLPVVAHHFTELAHLLGRRLSPLGKAAAMVITSVPHVYIVHSAYNSAALPIGRVHVCQRPGYIGNSSGLSKIALLLPWLEYPDGIHPQPDTF